MSGEPDNRSWTVEEMLRHALEELAGMDGRPHRAYLVITTTEHDMVARKVNLSVIEAIGLLELAKDEELNSA